MDWPSAGTSRDGTRIANPDPPARPPGKPPAEPIRIKVPPPRVETPEEPCRPEDEPEIGDIMPPPDMPPPLPPEERVKCGTRRRRVRKSD